jgi:hypothetical protein
MAWTAIDLAEDTTQRDRLFARAEAGAAAR